VDNNVQFFIQADFDVGDEETYQLLLYKIVELFVTVHGFSYSSNLMEKTCSELVGNIQ